MSSYYMNQDSGFNEARNLVSQMSVDELKKLLGNNEEITKLVRNLTEVQQIETVKESLKENTKRLAYMNLDKEPKLIHAREKLAEIHEELGRMRDEYKSILQQYDERTGETNPEIIYLLIQSDAADLEKKTDEKADDFFYGEKTEDEVTAFERSFIEDRKRAHELKIKAEKLHELMQMSQATSCLTSNQHFRGGGGGGYY